MSVLPETPHRPRNHYGLKRASNVDLLREVKEGMNVHIESIQSRAKNGLTLDYYRTICG